MSETEWIEVGEIAIDTGLCWLGDPGYLLPPQEAWAGQLGWEAFKQLQAERDCPLTLQWYFANRRSGLGVSVQTGYGDGRYPVFVQYDPATGRVAAVKVVFIDREEEQEDADLSRRPLQSAR